MAKRKKLNIRVVVLLAVLGVALAALLTGLFIGTIPKDVGEYYRQGVAALEKDEYASASNYLGTAIQEAKKQGAEKPEYYYQMARLQWEWANESPELTRSDARSLRSSARTNLDTALRVDSSFKPARRYLCELLWESSRLRGGTGQYWEDFIAEITKLIEQEPDNHEAIYQRAVAKTHQAAVKGQYRQQALDDFQKAVELQADVPKYWLGMIDLLIEQNQLVEAERKFADALEANPDSPEIRLRYAEYLSSHDREEEALAQIRQAIEQTPGSADPYLSLAEHYRQVENEEAALAALEDAEKADPTAWQVNLSLARYRETHGNLAGAVDELEEGLAKVSAELDRLNAQEMPLDQRYRSESRLRIARLEMNRSVALLLIRLAEATEDEQQTEAYLRQAEEHMAVLGEVGPDSPAQAEVAGRIAQIRGDVPEAMKQLQKAYEHFGTRRPRVAYDLMRLYLRQDAPGKAEDILDSLLATPGFTNQPDLLLLKAQIAMHYRQYEDAEQILRKLAPKDERARDLLATVRAILSPVAATLPEGVEPTERMVAILRQQASSAWVEGKRTEAVRILENLHRRAPEHWGVTSQLVNMYQGTDQKQKARRLLEEARQYHPDKTEIEYGLRMLDATDKQKRFELAMEAAGADEDPVRQELNRASVCAIFGMEEQYIEHLKKAMELQPDSPTVVARMLQYALREENWDLAEQCADAAEEANLDGLNGRVYRAQIAAVREDYDRAIELLVEPLEGRPDLKQAWALLASCYSRAGRLQRAKETYRELYEIDPSYAAGPIGLAQVTERLGEFQEHQKWVEQAHRLAPQNAYVRSRYLDLQEEQDNPYETIEQREKILEQNPADMRNVYRLAALYEQTEQYRKAERLYGMYASRLQSELDSAGVMAAFFERTGQRARIDELIGELLQTVDDKVAVYRLYGSFLQLHSPDQAEQAFRQAIEADPQDDRGYWALANFYGQRQQWDEAIEQVRKCLELKPDSVRYRKALMGYLVNAGEHDEAATRLREYLAENPDDAEAMTYEGVLALRRGEVEQARNLLDRAVESSPENALPLRYRAQLKIAEGRLNAAAEDLENALELSDNPELSVQLADVQLRMREHALAEGTLRQVLETYSGYAPAIQKLIAVYQQAKRWSLLESFLEDVRRQFPNDPRYSLLEADMWAARGAPLQEVAALERAFELAPYSTQAAGRYLQALLDTKQYQKVLDISQPHADAGDPPAWTLGMRGRAFAKLDRPREAEQAFTEALKRATLGELSSIGLQLLATYGQEQAIQKVRGWLDLRPDEPTVHMLLAQLYQESGDHQQAVGVLKQAAGRARTDAQKAQVNKLLGLAYHFSGQTENAEQAYLRCLEANAQDPWVMNNLAYLYVDVLDQPQKALPYAESAARLMPDDPNVLDTYGWTLLKLDRTGEAERQLMRAVQTAEPSATVRYHLGILYERTGRNRDALQQYRQGYELIRDDEGHELHAELKEAVDRVEEKLSG
jgi:tetratricopeptide (TPR) repeat protein